MKYLVKDHTNDYVYIIERSNKKDIILAILDKLMTDEDDIISDVERFITDDLDLELILMDNIDTI